MRSLLLVLASTTYTLAQDHAWTCQFSLADPARNYDLSPLAGPHTVQQTRDTPPSRMLDTVRFDVCKPLARVEGISNADQCAEDTYACLTKTNQKTDHNDRITTVIPLASTSSLAAKFAALPSPQSGVLLTLHGPSYPPASTPSHPQSLALTLLCAESDSDPKLTSYEGGVASVEWSSKAACPQKSDDPPPPGNESPPETAPEKPGEEVKSGGSGLGMFFFLLILAFAAYFGLGAYYNYNNYGATGWDLVPHRDFWRDVPYLLRDVATHLCSSVRPGIGGRSGYVSV
ncbi:hypothetical protein BOTBODRAFT_26104 [Botryobasidium botryosum FD-172 SS1]|uniref:Autophagy-related protein 27 n=1 Tax=Botryobasidium botryosum (strain FD-172 SS1) TaxID=930990 RepID=A0A067NC17_BOTB1|nr:hypothetical protein BOTBODRAFT_26104 [Botryobasidium botryosum FD-172 SS1]